MSIFIYLVVIIIVLTIIIYNKMINLKKAAEKSRSVIDIYLQQRFDLIPNLIKVTKEYMNYERGLLEKIAELISRYSVNKDNESMNKLNVEYHTIIANIENYPELKASEQFLKLQKSLIKIESQLQAARRIYNNDVTKYNIKISTFPNSILANILGFSEMQLFVLEGEDEVKVEF